MNITEYAIAKKLFGGGGGGSGKREGTAIPVGEAVERIYFNIHNTIEETNALLSQLTFVPTMLLEYPLCPIYAHSADGATGWFVFVVKAEDNYAIELVTDVQQKHGVTLYRSYDRNEHNGWIQSTNIDPYWIIPMGMCLSYENGQALTDYFGMPIGAENEKIKNVLSVTPF